MDALLSLPILGYFLMPVSTYGTSLNLLFFYMTWSTLVLSQPPLGVEVVGILVVRLFFFLAPALLFLLFDSIVPSLAVGLKTQDAPALPTRTGGINGAKKSKRRPQWYSVLGISLLNICLSIALQAAVELLFTKALKIRSALKITTTLPMPWSIAKDVARGLVLREILQYYIHRFILHSKSPNFFSRRHEAYFHVVTAPYSLVAHYDHPASYLLFRFIPTYLPSVIFRTHLLTYLLLLSMITLEETLTLSGYSCVPGIILGGITRRQDLHSECLGKGNFAPWGLLDWLHGTGIGPGIIEDVKDEAEKHHLAERTGNAWEGAKKDGRDGLRALKGRKRGVKKT